MKSFKSFLQDEHVSLTEAVSATAFEATITTAFNGGPEKDADTLAKAGVSEDAYRSVEQQSTRIAKLIRSKTRAGGKMIHFGVGSGKKIAWWQGGGIPKTDVYAGKVKISLKQAGGSQLMSARRGEALSTFRAAVEYMNEETPKETDKLLRLMEQSMKKFFTPQGVPLNTFKFLVKRVRKQGPASVKGEVRKKIEEFNAIEQASKAAATMLTEFMTTNKEFRRWFVYEAATGQKKFEPDPFADANWVVEFNPKSGNAKVEQLSAGRNSPAKFIDSLASGVSFKMWWKTGRGATLNKQGIASTEVSLRVSIPKSEQLERFQNVLPMLGLNTSVVETPGTSCIQDIYNEELKLFTEEGLVYLTEDGFIQSIVSFFKNLWNKVVAGMKAAAKKGILWLLDFLGIQLGGIEPVGMAFDLGA